MFKKTMATFAMVALLPLAGAANAVDVAVNGGFETGDFTGWQQFPSGTQTVGMFGATEGDFAAELNNNVPGSASLIKNANVGIGIVNPGDTIIITFDARGATGAGGVAFAEFFSELEGGGTSKTEILGNAPLALDPDAAVWTSFSFETTAGPDVSGGVTLQLTATTGADPSSVATIYYDNIKIDVAPIPLPAAAWLFGSALLGLMGIKRRRAA